MSFASAFLWMAKINISRSNFTGDLALAALGEVIAAKK